MVDMGWVNTPDITYSTDNTASTANAWYTTSSGPPTQQWFSVGPNGELVEMGMPEHNHALPDHQHEHVGNGDWSAPTWGVATFEGEPQNGISVDGEEIMRFNNDIKVKLNGEWISMEEMVNKIEALENALEKLVKNVYMNDMQRKEIQEKLLENKPVKEEVEHIDPDLFKI